MLFVFIACDSYEYENDVNISDETCTFKSFVSPSTENTTSGWEINDTIGISAYYAGTNTIYSGYINQQYQTVDKLNFSPVTGEDKIYLSQLLVDLVAYYPYQSGLSTNYYPFDLNDQSNQKSVDILYSNNAKNKNKLASQTTLVFDHALSKIVVYSFPEDGLTVDDIQGMSVSINNVYTQASLNLWNGEIIPSGTKGSIVMNTEPSGYKSEAILLPESLSGIEITFTLADAIVYKAKLPDDFVFNSSTVYHCQAKINKTRAVINPVGISDWEIVDDIPDNNSTVENTYEVGDYYPNPTDMTTAIGVVYWLVPGTEGREGKIVSFDTSVEIWSTSNNLPLNMSITDGVLNTAIVRTQNPSLELFPAFRWCVDKGDGWYFPARYELHVLQEQWSRNKELINEKILLVGGETLSELDEYYSSSESWSYPTIMAETYSFSTKDWPSIYKIEAKRIRAIKMF